jgi:hypothetical protein
MFFGILSNSGDVQETHCLNLAISSFPPPPPKDMAIIIFKKKFPEKLFVGFARIYLFIYKKFPSPQCEISSKIY